MGGQKFQYDESGGTFFYFLLSFLALLLIPGTYYWWPRKEKEGKVLMWHNSKQANAITPNPQTIPNKPNLTKIYCNNGTGHAHVERVPLHNLPLTTPSWFTFVFHSTDPEELEKQCHCPPCEKKREILSLEQPWKKTKQILT